MTNDLVALNKPEQWVHYSSDPTQIVFYDTDYSNAYGEHGFFKPIGLWITPYGQEDNWFEWALGEDFSVESLNYVHDVELAAAANILRVSSVEGLDAFAEEYAMDVLASASKRRNYLATDPSPVTPKMESWMYCDWPRLAQKYDGLIISPYQWGRRLMRGHKTDWYYSWDCASGCIWNARAIESIKLRSTVSAGYVEKPKRSITELLTEAETQIEGMTTGAKHAMAARDD